MVCAHINLYRDIYFAIWGGKFIKIAAAAKENTNANYFR
jgi:hypothetical protein